YSTPATSRQRAHARQMPASRRGAFTVSSTSTATGSSPASSSRAHRSRSGRCSPDRKSTRLNSSHQITSYAGFCLEKKKHTSSDPAPFMVFRFHPPPPPRLHALALHDALPILQHPSHLPAASPRATDARQPSRRLYRQLHLDRHRQLAGELVARAQEQVGPVLA